MPFSLAVGSLLLSATLFVAEAGVVDGTEADATPPQVASLTPPAGGSVRELTQVEVVFDEDVTGVTAGALLVDGVPASSVEGSGAGPYVFRFDSVRNGSVPVGWAIDHDIADLAAQSNAFGGGSWVYTINPDESRPHLLITEFVASNSASLLDAEGKAPDWIEVTNAGTESVDLNGIGLTDEPDEPGKWTFPSQVLSPGESVIVFASGESRRAPNGELHADFRLRARGEYLGLYSADSPRQLLSEYAPEYPPQRTDISYGLSGSQKVYLSTPTPGASNSAHSFFTGIAEVPQSSVERGFFLEPIQVALSCATANASIYYTLDGSEPDPATGQLYEEPFELAGTPQRPAVILRAVATSPGYLPSEVGTWTYVFPDAVLQQSALPDGVPALWGNGLVVPGDYEMDPEAIARPRVLEQAFDGLLSIPTLSIVTEADSLWGLDSGIHMNPWLSGLPWERPVSAELIYPDGREGFQIGCGIRVQGGSSPENWNGRKLSFRLLFKGDYGAKKLEFPVFSDSEVERFDTLILDGHYNYTYHHFRGAQRLAAKYCQDEYVSDLQLAAGSLAPHSVFVNLYLNGVFWGLYSVHERPDASFQAEHLGGDKEDYDALKHSGDIVVDGDRAAWGEMMGHVRAAGEDFARYLALQEWLDVAAFVDYMILNLFVGNDDWPRHNWYAGRRRADDGRFLFFNWDAEHVLVDPHEDRTSVDTENTPGEIFQRLREVPEFRLLFADRVQRLFFDSGLLALPYCEAWQAADGCEGADALSLYMDRVEEIDQAIILEAMRWGDSRRETPHTRERDWITELARLHSVYFSQRASIVLQQFVREGLYPQIAAPLFNVPGGEVDRGAQVVLSPGLGAATEVFFTTDGTDPRNPDSGEPTATARRYLTPISIQYPTRVLARARSGQEWSPLTEADYRVEVAYDGLEVTEIMYNPVAGREFEFLELQNTSSSTIDLWGLAFVDGVQFAFPAGTVLAGGQIAVVVASRASFSTLQPGVTVLGEYEGNLDNGGERLTLVDPLGGEILSFRYDDEDGWPVAADGLRYSLVRRDVSLPTDDPASWRASSQPRGSPGEADGPPSTDGIVINEVLTRTTAPFEDAVELLNTTTQPVDVSGWFLSDRREPFDRLFKYRLPAGSVVPAGGHLVVYENQFNPSPGTEGSFALSSAGEEIYLSSTSGLDGMFTGYVASLRFGPLAEGQSFGRVLRSGRVGLAPLARPTFGSDDPSTVEEFRLGSGAINSAPFVGNVVIHEVHYHPADSGVEFVELLNRGGEEIALYDAALGAGWKLGGVSTRNGDGSFEFPEGARLQPFGMSLVVPSAPAFFQALHDVPASVEIYGPYGGALSNGGESLTLLRPTRTEAGSLIYVPVDFVDYSDATPWPVEADGGGSSLERRSPGAYGNDAQSWAASTIAGGTPGTHNSVGLLPPNFPPVATFLATADEDPRVVTFDATAASDPDGRIIQYSWTFADGRSAEGPVVTHTYTRNDAVEVVLEVVDDDGATSEATQILRLGSEFTENLPPLPFFTLSSQRGVVPLTVALDAGSYSADPDGSIVNYNWKFSDGGIAEGDTLSYTFSTTGNFEILLTVEDDEGAVSEARRTVLVTPVGEFGLQLPGDCNQDGTVDLSDPVCIFGVLFLGRPENFPCGDGDRRDPSNLALLDWTGSGDVDLSSGIALLQFLFAAGGPHHALPQDGGIGCLPIVGCPDNTACP